MTNSQYFSQMFGTDEMRAVFSDESMIQAWLDTEAALARAEEAVGVAPLGTGDKIAEAARIEKIDLSSMKAGFVQAGFPIIPFVKELSKVCDAEAAKWVHYGLTSQDIQDTGWVLQLRQAFVILERDLVKLIGICVGLIERHRNTVMAGRSFQQHAAPITFGYKAAVWLEEMLRHHERLKQLLPRVLVAQCSGAVGTLASLNEYGPSVRQEFSRLLGLGLTELPWHVSRDSLAESLNWTALLGATLGKIANEIGILMRTEIDELREPYKQGRGGSSTMPQKRNPVICEPIIAAAHRLRELAASQQVAMIQEHERGIGHMHLEWLTIPDAFVLISGSLSQVLQLLDGLFVNAEAMRTNLNHGGGYLMAEAVMMGLAPHIGRHRAHETVSTAAKMGRDKGLTLKEALFADADITNYLSESDLDNLLDPANYIGCTNQMIDAVLKKAEIVIEKKND